MLGFVFVLPIEAERNGKMRFLHHNAFFDTRVGKMLTAKASAPGKAILFGEHAVVHGATAIAAAVSDLRIEVTTVRNE